MNLVNRREFLRDAALTGMAGLLSERLTAQGALLSVHAPTSPVAITRCSSYELPALVQQLESIVDRLGGLKRLVAGKTVAVKVNITGSPGQPAIGLPAGRTYQVHPRMAHALALLLDRAGAKRIRFLEGTYSTASIERHFLAAGWDLKALAAVKTPVEFEDTRNLGRGKRYSRFTVPWGGSLFPAYELNHSYVDCDVYISLAKLKNHRDAGVTLSMKNSFGITPTALYGSPDANEQNTANREEVLHNGAKVPAGVPPELHPNSPRRPDYRVPRVIVDLNGIRPIDLAIIDGIETVSGGEGPWWPDLVHRTPHLLLAGRNAVCTDAVAVACMGYDPMAKPGTGPFPGDNHLALAAQVGLGTNDPGKIEVVGLPIQNAHYPFGWQP